MSTEFHFDQVQIIHSKNKLILRLFLAFQINDQLDKITHEKLNSAPGDKNRNGGGGKFKPGDFYITRHSNLSQMHIIFHLVSDESFERFILFVFLFLF